VEVTPEGFAASARHRGPRGQHLPGVELFAEHFTDNAVAISLVAVAFVVMCGWVVP
jgi:hypothetical protein